MTNFMVSANNWVGFVLNLIFWSLQNHSCCDSLCSKSVHPSHNLLDQIFKSTSLVEKTFFSNYVNLWYCFTREISWYNVDQCWLYLYMERSFLDRLFYHSSCCDLPTAISTTTPVPRSCPVVHKHRPAACTSCVPVRRCWQVRGLP